MNRASGHICTGIDVGSDSLRVVQIRRKGGRFTVTNAVTASLADLGRLDESKRKDARTAMVLRNAMKESGVRPVGAIANVASGRVLMKYSQIPPVPSWKLNMLMKYEIEAESTDRKGEVATDFRLLDLPITSDRCTVLMTMVQKEAVDNRLSLLSEAGVRPVDVTVSPVGFYHNYVHEKQDDGVTLLVCIGAASTDLVFVGGDRFYFARTLGRGGRAFTEAVAEELDIPFQDAEKRKQTGLLSASIIEDAPTEDDAVSNALLGPAEQLASDIHSGMLFCRAQTNMVDMSVSRIVLVGGGGMLPGLDDVISAKVDIPVEECDLLTGLDTDRLSESERQDIQDNLPAYSQAIGLALAGLKDETFFLSVFPDEVKEKRRFRSREIFLWYAAAMFAAGLILFTASGIAAKYRRSDYLAEQKAALKGAEENRLELEDIERRNRMWGARVGALEDRLYRGRRLLDAMSAVKKATPEQIRLLGLETMSEQTATPESREPYNSALWFYVKGLVKSPETPAAGEEILKEYTQAIRDQDVLQDARILPTYAYENDQVYFEMRIELRNG